MNRTKLNYWVDVALAISFFICFITGLLKLPLLMTTFNFSYATLPKNISFLHDWSGVVMGLLVFLHLVLHWTWIKSVTKSFFVKSGKTGGKN